MKKILIFPLLFYCVTVSAQQETGRTLQDCLIQGLERNYSIRITRNLGRIADNNATLGNAGFLPSADITGGYSGSVNNTTRKLDGDGSYSTNNGVHDYGANAGLNIGWTVFNGFSVRTTYEKLVELRDIGDLNTRLQVENFISEFTSAYYQYIRQYIRLKNLRYAVELSSERVRIVEARYEIGATSRLDLQQANVDLNTDKSLLIKQYEVLHTLYTSLNRMMVADDIETPLLTADSMILYDAGLEREVIWRNTRDNNIFLMIARKEGDITRLDMKLVQSQSYPYMRLSTGYGYNGNWYGSGTYSRQNVHGFNYGLTVGVNIFDGFNQKRRVRNARIEVENTDLEYEQTELAVKVDLSQAWMAYRNNMALVALEKDNLETARDNYDIAIERYKLGQLSGIELREAQTSLLEAEERLVQAEYDTKLCEISLHQIGGTIVTYLDPSAEYM